MIIELSPKKIINGAYTVWNQPGPEVDLVVDLKKLSFKEGSIEEMYVFHVLDHLFDNEIVPALENWRKCLAPDRQLFVIVDDFEYLARAFVGGDLNIDDLNFSFAHPTNITHDNLLRYMKAAGFSEEKIVTWRDNVQNAKGEIIFPKQQFELIFSGKRNE